MKIVEELQLEYTPHYTRAYNSLSALDESSEYRDKPILCKTLKAHISANLEANTS